MESTTVRKLYCPILHSISISNIAFSKEVIFNFERDNLFNYTAFSGHRTPRFALRAKTIGDNIRIVSGFGMNMILGWLISKLLLGWVGFCLSCIKVYLH